MEESRDGFSIDITVTWSPKRDLEEIDKITEMPIEVIESAIREIPKKDPRLEVRAVIHPFVKTATIRDLVEDPIPTN